MACDQTECDEPSPLDWICSNKDTENMIVVMGNLGLNDWYKYGSLMNEDFRGNKPGNILEYISYAAGCEYFKLSNSTSDVMEFIVIYVPVKQSLGQWLGNRLRCYH